MAELNQMSCRVEGSDISGVYDRNPCGKVDKSSQLQFEPNEYIGNGAENMHYKIQKVEGVSEKALLIKYNEEEFPKDYIPTVFDRYKAEWIVNNDLVTEAIKENTRLWALQLKISYDEHLYEVQNNGSLQSILWGDIRKIYPEVTHQQLIECLKSIPCKYKKTYPWERSTLTEQVPSHPGDCCPKVWDTAGQDDYILAMIYRENPHALCGKSQQEIEDIVNAVKMRMRAELVKQRAERLSGLFCGHKEELQYDPETGGFVVLTVTNSMQQKRERMQQAREYQLEQQMNPTKKDIRNARKKELRKNAKKNKK